MSWLRSRLGLLESHAASLSLLGRGQRSVRGGLLSSNGCQMRMVAWWKRNWEDEGQPEDAFAAEESSRTAHEARKQARKQTRKRREELPPDFPEYVSNGTVRGVSRSSNQAWDMNEWDERSRSGNPESKTERFVSWGINATPGSEAEAQAMSGLGWSQSTEDKFWELQSRYDEDDSQTTVETPDRSYSEERAKARRERREHEALRQLNYALQLPKAVRRRDTDLIMRCLRAAEARADMNFIEEIPEDTFSEILSIMEPERNIGSLLSLSNQVSELMAVKMPMVNLEAAAIQYGAVLQAFAELRRRSGHRLNGEQYLTLLESARFLGLRHVAIKLWNFLHDDGIKPDIAMYNALLATFVHAGRHNHEASRAARVITSNMIARENKSMEYRYSNYHIGQDGIRERSMVILDAMLKHGITGNEETYCALITAAAKEGETGTIKSILRTVWNIDVDKLMAPDPEERRTMDPRKPPRDDPQYPTEKLLHSLAYGFGINNDMPTALRLVDYISREYVITIDFGTWSILFEWTFILARHSSLRNEEKRVGELPMPALLQLWNTMTGPPYSIKPSMAMYDRMLRNLYQRSYHIAFLTKMCEATVKCEESRQEREKARVLFIACLEEEAQGRHGAMPATQARRNWEITNIVNRRHGRYMRIWLRKFFKMFGVRAKQYCDHGEWISPLVFETVPRVVLNWQKYLDTMIQYETPTGSVELQVRSQGGRLERAVRNERILEMHERLASRVELYVGESWLPAPLVGAREHRRALEAEMYGEPTRKDSKGEGFTYTTYDDEDPDPRRFE